MDKRLMLRPLAAAILAVFLLTSTPTPASAGATDATTIDATTIDATTIDEMAAALGEDPVLVHQALGNGDTAGAIQRLHEAIRGADVPIYSALVANPGGLEEKFPSADLANRLHQRLGDGVYIVKVTGGILQVEAWGVPEQETLTWAGQSVAREVSEKLDYEPGRTRVTTVAEAQIIAEMAAAGPPYEMDVDRAHEIATAPGNISRVDPAPSYDQPKGPVSGALRAFLITLVGLSVLIVGLRLLLWATGRKEARKPGPAAARERTGDPTVAGPDVLDLDDLVDDASRATTRLSQAVAKAPSSSYAETATAYREAAEAVLRDLDDRATPDDPARYGTQLRDAVGALVLAEAGVQELSRARAKGDPGRYLPCFFDPMHGHAEQRAEVPGGRTKNEVPVCGQCSARIARGDAPDALVFAYPSRRRPKPYYEERGLWARTGYGSLDSRLWRTVLTERSKVHP